MAADGSVRFALGVGEGNETADGAEVTTIVAGFGASLTTATSTLGAVVWVSSGFGSDGGVGVALGGVATGGASIVGAGATIGFTATFGGAFVGSGFFNGPLTMIGSGAGFLGGASGVGIVGLVALATVLVVGGLSDLRG